MARHVPTERKIPGRWPLSDNVAVDCSCGHRGNAYVHQTGARWEFLTHVVLTTVEKAGWPGEHRVEYTEALDG